MCVCVENITMLMDFSSLNEANTLGEGRSGVGLVKDFHKIKSELKPN